MMECWLWWRRGGGRQKEGHCSLQYNFKNVSRKKSVKDHTSEELSLSGCGRPSYFCQVQLLTGRSLWKCTLGRNIVIDFRAQKLGLSVSGIPWDAHFHGSHEDAVLFPTVSLIPILAHGRYLINICQLSKLPLRTYNILNGWLLNMSR